MEGEFPAAPTTEGEKKVKKIKLMAMALIGAVVSTLGTSTLALAAEEAADNHLASGSRGVDEGGARWRVACS